MIIIVAPNVDAILLTLYREEACFIQNRSPSQIGQRASIPSAISYTRCILSYTRMLPGFRAVATDAEQCRNVRVTLGLLSPSSASLGLTAREVY